MTKHPAANQTQIKDAVSDKLKKEEQKSKIDEKNEESSNSTYYYSEDEENKTETKPTVTPQVSEKKEATDLQKKNQESSSYYSYSENDENIQQRSKKTDTVKEEKEIKAEKTEEKTPLFKDNEQKQGEVSEDATSEEESEIDYYSGKALHEDLIVEKSLYVQKSGHSDGDAPVTSVEANSLIKGEIPFTKEEKKPVAETSDSSSDDPICLTPVKEHKISPKQFAAKEADVKSANPLKNKAAANKNGIIPLSFYEKTVPKNQKDLPTKENKPPFAPKQVNKKDNKKEQEKSSTKSGRPKVDFKWKKEFYKKPNQQFKQNQNQKPSSGKPGKKI